VAGETYQPKGEYLTEHQDISGKADKATTLAGYGITDAYTKAQVDSAIATGVAGVDLDDYAKTADVAATYQPKGNYLTEHQDLSDYAKSADLAMVATTGSYNDLENKPEIPSIEGLVTTTAMNTALADYTPTATLQTTYALKTELPDIDNALSLTSENALQNKIITEYLNQRFSTSALPGANSGEWVFGFVDGEPQYIKVVDANGN
jgi:hypothetical protein